MAAGGDPREACDRRQLADRAVPVAVERLARELQAIATRLDPGESDAPDLLPAAGGKAERGERDRELDLVPVGGDPAGRVPDRIPRSVLAVVAAPVLGLQVVAEEVHLHPERADVELEGAPAVEERVEPHADEVAVVGLVAVGEAGADRFGVGILGVAADIEPRAVVEQAAGGRDRRRAVLAGLGLEGERDDRALLPGGLVEHAVDADRRRGAGRPQSEGRRLVAREYRRYRSQRRCQQGNGEISRGDAAARTPRGDRLRSTHDAQTNILRPAAGTEWRW